VRRFSPLLALALTAVATLATGCTSSGPGSAHGHGGIPATNATTAPLLPTQADALPDVTPDRLKTLLRQLHGVPVVLNVWGSWCGPCREEGPRLAAAAKRYGARVQFLGLDVKDEQNPARTFIRQMDWTYPSLFDPSPNGAVEVGLGYIAQPVTVFFARTGRRIAVVSGPVTAPDLIDGIRKIVRGVRGGSSPEATTG
jgi:thiol-disulfide isomerase/thioredoxin